jgi:hypothetical protein
VTRTDKTTPDKTNKNIQAREDKHVLMLSVPTFEIKKKRIHWIGRN